MLCCRVPIIKCHIRSPSGAGSLKTDISLNVGNGVKAVEGIKAHLLAMPPLRPLVLAAKALVKVQHPCACGVCTALTQYTLEGQECGITERPGFGMTFAVW